MRFLVGRVARPDLAEQLIAISHFELDPPLVADFERSRGFHRHQMHAVRLRHRDSVGRETQECKTQNAKREGHPLKILSSGAQTKCHASFLVVSRAVPYAWRKTPSACAPCCVLNLRPVGWCRRICWYPRDCLCRATFGANVARGKIFSGLRAALRTAAVADHPVLARIPVFPVLLSAFGANVRRSIRPRGS